MNMLGTPELGNLKQSEDAIRAALKIEPENKNDSLATHQDSPRAQERRRVTYDEVGKWIETWKLILAIIAEKSKVADFSRKDLPVKLARPSFRENGLPRRLRLRQDALFSRVDRQLYPRQSGSRRHNQAANCIR